MPDMEKVIDSLEADAQSCGDMVLIPSGTYYDTLELLKEQEKTIDPETMYEGADGKLYPKDW